MSARSGTTTPNSSEPKRVRSLGAALQEIRDLLIDRDSAGPAGRRVRAALDVAGVQLHAGQQTAHAAHVIVAVAAHLVAHPVQDEHLVAVGFQRLEAFFDREILALLVRPEVRQHNAVRAEHHDQPLFAALRVGEPKARQVADKRRGGGADAKAADEFASRGGTSHVPFLCFNGAGSSSGRMSPPILSIIGGYCSRFRRRLASAARAGRGQMPGPAA